MEIDNIQNFSEYLLEKEEKERKEREYQNNLVAAKANGYETFDDYEYSYAKSFSRDPRFSLNKVYAKKCEKYLIDTIKLYIKYIRTGNVYMMNEDGSARVLTIYSLNALSEAIFEKNDVVLTYLNTIHANSLEFLQTISETQISAKKIDKLKKRSL